MQSDTERHLRSAADKKQWLSHVKSLMCHRDEWVSGQSNTLELLTTPLHVNNNKKCLSYKQMENKNTTGKKKDRM